MVEGRRYHGEQAIHAPKGSGKRPGVVQVGDVGLGSTRGQRGELSGIPAQGPDGHTPREQESDQFPTYVAARANDGDRGHGAVPSEGSG